MEACSWIGYTPPSDTFQLSHPDLALQPEYDLFGGEYQTQIADHASWWGFVRAHHIQYVVQADYCGGDPDYHAGSIEAFPVIDAGTRAALILDKVFSPFGTDSCE